MSISSSRVRYFQVLGVGLFLCAPLLSFLGSSVASAEPAEFPPGLSMLQRACIKHYSIKTAHLKIQADLPDGWKEQSELWVERPGRLSFHTTISSSKPGGPSVESQVLADGGKTLIWSSQPNPAQPEMKNVYIQFESPPDVTSLESLSVARFGLAQFVLRLLTGDPSRLAVAQIGDKGQLDFEKKIISPTADEVDLQSEGGKEQDELTFEPSTGLIKTVRARADGKVVASGEITYLSVNQPSDASAFAWKLPAGAREIKQSPQK